MSKYKDGVKPDWWVDIDRIRTDYVVLEDLSRFMGNPIRLLHPDHPDYLMQWAKETKRCIEGIWSNQFDKWRWMPGSLYFYGKFGVIQHLEQGIIKYIKPYIVDFIWDYAYDSTVCRGFSGFEKDNEYSCNYHLKNHLEGNLDIKYVPEECYKKDGTLKIYKDPYQYLFEGSSKNLGKPLFKNTTKDELVLGCHAKGTKVRMFDGSLKSVENVKVGDKLMGINSTPRTVLKLHRGREKMYKIKQDYGKDYVVNENHIMHVSKYNPRKKEKTYHNITVKDLLNKFKSYKNYKRPDLVRREWESVKSGEIDYGKKEYTYDPYFIGLWLGDGFKQAKMICVPHQDPEILNWLKDYANSKDHFDYSIRESRSGLTNCLTYRFRLINNQPDEKSKKSWFGKVLKNNKHIPDIYKYGSVEDRLKLLAGMIDTDGSLEENRFTISSTDLSLLKDFQEVARSLGFRSEIHKPSITGLTDSLKYNLRISGEITKIPTIIPRKQAAKDTGKKGSNRNYFKIEELEIDDYYGFELDKDHLYLLEDYTVTHNSRGSSKSYWVALGELEYRYVFYDAKSYNQYRDLRFNGLKSEQCVGAESVDKSSDLLDKFYDSQIAKANSSNKDFVKWFGIWDEGGSNESLVPCPFYKMSKGSLKPGNKKQTYRHEYDKKQNGKWIPQGSKSKIFHVNYSSKKGDGETAASGGRYNFSNVEEVGLTPTYTKIKGHNEETVKRGGVRFGVQWAQGTSGLVEYIQAAKDIMLNPESYDVLSFPNQFGTEGKNGRIGRFIPAYITHFRFKDKHGNTDFQKAIEHENNERRRMSNSDDPSVLRLYRMNRPCYINEMWLTDKGYYFPYEELSLREQELMNGNLYETIGTPVQLSRTSGGDITYEVNHKIKPINTFPVDKDMDDPSGSVVIYEFPERDIPLDMYAFVGHDPYVEEDINKGGSLGVTYVLKNPKYISEGYTGNIIVASYIGKPLEGLDVYYDNQCKLLEFYGATHQSLWYEKNRGDLCRAYYINNHKISYLAPTPQRTQGSSMHQKTIRSFGFIVGNKSSKLNLIKLTRDWLIEETEFKESDGIVRKKMNLFRIPDLFLIRQLMMFTMEDNFDGVSAFLGCILGLREFQSNEADEILIKKNRNAGLYKNFLKASMRVDDRNMYKSKKSSIFDAIR